MLSLKSSNSSELASKHYASIQFYLNQILNFYLNFFKLINDEIDTSQAIDILYTKSHLEGTTITKLSRSLGYGVNKKYKIKKSNIIKAIKSPNTHLNKLLYKNQIEFVNLLNDIKDNLENIIVSEPKELISLESTYKTKYSFIVKANGEYEESIKNILLSNIFNYNKFSDKTGFPINENKDSFWERYDLSKSLNISTCSYCNRIFTITVVNEKGEGVISPSIDHFFDKVKHPFFALSFYNLIPSCTNCNSSLKGITKFSIDKYIHPYLSGFGENAIFSYRALDTASALGELANLEIFIDIMKGSPIEIQISNNISKFQLNKIYSQHADLAQELIRKKIISNDRYLDILRFETFKKLELSLEESYRIAFGNFFNEEDFHKRPLAKFTKDIAKELKMI